MKLKDLKDLLNSMPSDCYDDIVRIATKNPSLGFTSASTLKNVFGGFDWDSGKILFYCDSKIIKNNIV